MHKLLLRQLRRAFGIPGEDPLAELASALAPTAAPSHAGVVPIADALPRLLAAVDQAEPRAEAERAHQLAEADPP